MPDESFYSLFHKIKDSVIGESAPNTLEDLEAGIQKLKEGMTGPLAALERLRDERKELDTWDRFYKSLPSDIKAKINLYDFKRLGECFKQAFRVEE